MQAYALCTWILLWAVSLVLRDAVGDALTSPSDSKHVLTLSSLHLSVLYLSCGLRPQPVWCPWQARDALGVIHQLSSNAQPTADMLCIRGQCCSALGNNAVVSSFHHIDISHISQASLHKGRP